VSSLPGRKSSTNWPATVASGHIHCKPFAFCGGCGEWGYTASSQSKEFSRRNLQKNLSRDLISSDRSSTPKSKDRTLRQSNAMMQQLKSTIITRLTKRTAVDVLQQRGYDKGSGDLTGFQRFQKSTDDLKYVSSEFFAGRTTTAFSTRTPFKWPESRTFQASRFSIGNWSRHLRYCLGNYLDRNWTEETLFPEAKADQRAWAITGEFSIPIKPYRKIQRASIDIQSTAVRPPLKKSITRNNTDCKKSWSA